MAPGRLKIWNEAEGAWDYPPGGSQPGVAQWYGPYTLDFNNLTDDGDTVTLFATTAGDMLVGAFYDPVTAIEWNSEGPDIAFNEDPPGPNVDNYAAWLIDPTKFSGSEADNARDLSAGNSKTLDGSSVNIGQRRFAGGTFKAKITQGAETPATAGNMDCYFAIVSGGAVAP